MVSKVEPIDLSRVNTFPLAQRSNKVCVEDFAQVVPPGVSLRAFLRSLPRILAGQHFLDVVEHILEAKRQGRPVIWGMGAHVIKCGLSPWVLQLMRQGVLSGVAFNGASAIHDLEIALIGATSEDVARGLADGSFGMAHETAELMNRALDRVEVAKGDVGMGEALGHQLVAVDAPFRQYSVLAAGIELGIPVTVHVAIGTDIVHMHPSASGALIGQASFTDFRLFAALVSGLSNGGVYLNVGSAVVLPEVFLKAFAVAQNLGHNLHDFITVNLDMNQQYRPLQNVVKRRVKNRGKGYAIVGCHEIMIPLLAAAVLEGLCQQGGRQDG